MSDHSLPSTYPKRSTVDKTLRWIGDLDHPFYDDERHRFVWYESSAIAFQLVFIGNYLTMGLVLWIAGAKALPYTVVVLVPTIVAAAVLLSYATRNSAEYTIEKRDLGRRRGQLGLAAVAFMVTGLGRAALDDQLDGSFMKGFKDGTLAGMLCLPFLLIATVLYQRHKNKKKVESQDR